jgi:hypothetical protein
VTLLALGGSDCEAIRDAVLGQPANSLSSLAYVAGAAVILRRGGPPGPALALAAVGVGSFLYHGPMPPGADAVHNGAIVALVVLTAAAAWHRRALPRPPVLAVVALAPAVVLNLLGRTGAPLCRPDSLAQPHAAWHVLTAVAAAAWLAGWPRRADLTSSTRTRFLQLLVVGLGVVAAGVLSGAQGAGATPSCLQPVGDRYEPGDEVTVVGYGCVRRPSHAAGDIPVVFGYLHVMPAEPCAGVSPTVYCNPTGLHRPQPLVDPASGIPVGQISLEESPHPWRGLRASLTFRIPADLAPGSYHILTCGQPCTADPQAYPTEPWPLYVGVDPPAGERPVHHWPLDDPAIALLPDDALVLGPDGDEATVAEVRAQLGTAAGPSERVETAARADDTPGGRTPLVVWIVAAALVLAGGGAVTRRGPPRKRIRPGD